MVKRDLQNRYLIGDTWSPTAFMRTLKYFLEDAVKNKAILHQLEFIKAFLKTKAKNKVFVKLDIRYADYFPDYDSYFGRAPRLLKSMYGMNNSGNLSSDELTYWFVNEVGLKNLNSTFLYIIRMHQMELIFIIILC